jgi:uncharacterized protein YecT (DUF1311 family)
MKSKFYAVIMATVIAAFLIGCSKEPPKCSDDGTTKLVRQIILDQIGGREGLSEKEIQDNMKIEYPRASAFDKNIKKYSCEARLIAGDAYQLSITYESQLDDKNQHIVSVGGIRPGDLMGVKQGIIAGITKSREPKSEASPQPQTEPTAPPDQSSSIEQSGICKGLDLSITAENIECLNRKYAAADKELNDVYKQTMSRLEQSRKSVLKKEQIAWVKEKELKCPNAGKEVEGGTLEAVMIHDCFVRMTEQRVAYLKTFL